MTCFYEKKKKQQLYSPKPKINKQNHQWQGWHCSQNPSNVWFQRIWWNSQVTYCIYLLQYMFWLKCIKIIWPSLVYILERKSILAAFLDNFVYPFLILYSNLESGGFLKDSYNLESETISMSSCTDWSYVYKSVLHFRWIFFLPMHNFCNIVHGSLGKSDSLQYINNPSDHTAISKITFMNIPSILPK